MAKKLKDSVNEVQGEVMDLREQGAIDIRSSVGTDQPIPITGDVGVMVLGKDPARSAIVADVIHSQLQKIGMPMVMRHEFHDVGKSHMIEYDEPSVMDLIGRRDPKLFGTAVVVAHDNIGHKLVGSQQHNIVKDMVERHDLVSNKEISVSRIPPFPPDEQTRILFGDNGRGDQAISDIADETHNAISEAVTDALIAGIYKVEPSVPPVARLAAMEAFIARTNVGSAAYDGYRRVENMIIAAQQVEDHIEERVDQNLPILPMAKVEDQLLTHFAMQNNISHPDPTDEDREMENMVEDELGGLLTGYLGIHQDVTMRQTHGVHARTIDGKSVNYHSVTSADEVNDILLKSGLDDETREKVLAAFMGTNRPPISSARTISPGKGFNDALQKLEGVVDDLGKLNQKRNLTKGDPEVVLRRVQQIMNESNSEAADTIEDLLTDASELPPGVTVQANGVRLTNDKEMGATVKFLKNGVTVGRF